jgi:hypothetical protein
MLSIKYNVIIFDILSFNKFIHNCNEIYKLIINYNILFKTELIVWIIQRFDLSASLLFNVNMNDLSFTKVKWCKGVVVMFTLR